MTYSKKENTIVTFLDFLKKGTMEEREKVGAIFTCLLVYSNALYVLLR